MYASKGNARIAEIDSDKGEVFITWTEISSCKTVTYLYVM